MNVRTHCLNALSLAGSLPGWRRAPHGPAQAALATLQAWWHALCADERTRYLGAASDLVDLERRMRHIDNEDRRPWLPPR